MAPPPLMQMQTPPLQAPGINPQAMAMLQAALKQGQPGGGAPATPGLLAPGGGVANMMGGGMGNGLLSKMFPQAPPTQPAAPGMPPIDPLADPSMSGAGPSPTALT